MPDPLSRPILLLIPLLLPLTGCTSTPQPPSAQLIFQDDFRHGLDHWFLEAAAPGRVEARDGVLTIDVPAGCTLWLRQPLESPILIEYQARAVQAGGPNDRVSDLNCFWMAFDPEHPEDLFARPRTGRFEEYHRLRCYYASIGGNNNTTTRFRRYIGDPEHRPLLPQHDLRDPEFLLVPNRWYTLQLVAAGSRIEFWCDGRRLFDLDDPEPYTRGWFAFRTVASHLEIRHFRIFRLPR